MNNYVKVMLFIFATALLFATQVSAYSYNSYTDTNSFSYSEDLGGANRGFTIMHSTSMPRTNPSIGCDYYDWTSDFRKCRRTAYYDGHIEDYYAYYDGYYNHNNYDEEKVVKEAFKTYQQSSKQQYQLESKRLDSMNKRYGYGSGYSGVRYYRYGW